MNMDNRLSGVINDNIVGFVVSVIVLLSTIHQQTEIEVSRHGSGEVSMGL